MNTSEQATIDGLRAELAELREVVDHLRSGEAELRLRRLVIVDEDGTERITTHATRYESEIQVQGPGAHAVVHAADGHAVVAVRYSDTCDGALIETHRGGGAFGVDSSTLTDPLRLSWAEEEGGRLSMDPASIQPGGLKVFDQPETS
ncbi:MAG: hypothetical protein JST64_00885 [Actinobacteria bacterium]|nr:hypothetical protein [Actinomycetota bacterium]